MQPALRLLQQVKPPAQVALQLQSCLLLLLAWMLLVLMLGPCMLHHPRVTATAALPAPQQTALTGQTLLLWRTLLHLLLQLQVQNLLRHLQLQ